jgi:hypothetical protein
MASHMTPLKIINRILCKLHYESEEWAEAYGAAGEEMGEKRIQEMEACNEDIQFYLAEFARMTGREWNHHDWMEAEREITHLRNRANWEDPCAESMQEAMSENAAMTGPTGWSNARGSNRGPRNWI